MDTDGCTQSIWYWAPEFELLEVEVATRRSHHAPAASMAGSCAVVGCVRLYRLSAVSDSSVHMRSGHRNFFHVPS